MTSTFGFRRLSSPAFSALALTLISFLLLGCGSGIVNAPVSVSIPALAGEDIQGPCQYDLQLSSFSDVERGVFVLFDREDTFLLYQDETLRDLMRAQKFSLVFAHECDAISSGDLQADASQGPARMLFAALAQFAAETDHPELATSGVLLYGFSAAGVLTATLANDHPGRLLGTVQYAAGDMYFNLDTLAVTPAAAKIPSLILAGSNDVASGTSRNLRYFQRGRVQAAPWAYAVQPGAVHCCTLTTLPVILPWLQAVASGSTSASVAGGFVCTPDGYIDYQGETDCAFSQASLATYPAGDQSVWLPNSTSASEWLTWVTSAGAN